MTRGLSIIFYGPEGMGKTSLALQFKKELLFISVNENGYENLDMVGDVPANCEHIRATTFPQLKSAIKEAKHYSTVVIDSLSGVQQILADYILKEHYSDKNDPQQAFASFSEGHRCHAPFYSEQICNELSALNSQGVNTILLGHTKSEIIKNPGGLDYNATVIDLEQWSRGVYKKWAMAIIYMTLNLDLIVTKKWKGTPQESKAVTDLESDSDRIMYTTKNPTHEAKNLLKLPPYILMGDSPQEAYENLFKHMPPKIQEAQAQ